MFVKINYPPLVDELKGISLTSTETSKRGYDYAVLAAENIAGELVFEYDIREAVHDGYCSDPGDDVGEWEYKRRGMFPLTLAQYDYLLTHAAPDGTIAVGVMGMLLPALRNECGYCGYNTDYVVREGTLRPTLRIAQTSITEAAIAMLPLKLPAYCVLAILEFALPYVKYMDRAAIVKVLQGLRNSANGLPTKRQSTVKHSEMNKVRFLRINALNKLGMTGAKVPGFFWRIFDGLVKGRQRVTSTGQPHRVAVRNTEFAKRHLHRVRG